MEPIWTNRVPVTIDDINQLLGFCQGALAAVWSREGCPPDKYDVLRDLLRDAEAASRELA